jgi:hypothetical protein
MPGTFKIGDRVSWNSEAGRVSGVIRKKISAPIEFKGYTVHASREEPQYLIESDRTDHLAMHKGSALRKLPAPPGREGRRGAGAAGAAMAPDHDPTGASVRTAVPNGWLANPGRSPVAARCDQGAGGCDTVAEGRGLQHGVARGGPERSSRRSPVMRTLSNAIERLVSRGSTAHFGVVGDRLRAFDSGKTFGARADHPRVPAVRRRLGPRRREPHRECVPA